MDYDFTYLISQDGKSSSSNPEVNALYPELTLTKSVDIAVWSNWEPTITLTLSNNSDKAFKNLVLNDILDPQNIELVTSSVKINGTTVPSTQFTYDKTTGIFELPLPDLSPKSTTTISFEIGRHWGQAVSMIMNYSNFATIAGDFENVQIEFPSNTLDGTNIAKLDIRKTADPMYWTNTNLTFTLTIHNDTDDPFENLILNDELDPYCAFVENSVKLNGVVIPPEKISYDKISRILTVEVGTVGPQSAGILTFEVKRAK